MAEVVDVTTGTVTPGTGSAGLQTQAGGAPATVSGAAEATGGVDAGNFVEVDIDEELFKFNSDDTPLMNLMLRAKKVKVDSPEVDHYMIDEPRSSVRTSALMKITFSHRRTGKMPQQAIPLFFLSQQKTRTFLVPMAHWRLKVLTAMLRTARL